MRQTIGKHKMLLKELWPDDDKKKIVGKPDAMHVSMTEKYEVRDFIAHILDAAGKSHSDANWQAVLDAINSSQEGRLSCAQH